MGHVPSDQVIQSQSFYQVLIPGSRAVNHTQFYIVTDYCQPFCCQSNMYLEFFQTNAQFHSRKLEVLL